MPIANSVAAALGRGSARLSRRVPPVGYTVNAWSMFGVCLCVCVESFVRCMDESISHRRAVDSQGSAHYGKLSQGKSLCPKIGCPMVQLSALQVIIPTWQYSSHVLARGTAGDSKGPARFIDAPAYRIRYMT